MKINVIEAYEELCFHAVYSYMQEGYINTINMQQLYDEVFTWESTTPVRFERGVKYEVLWQCEHMTGKLEAIASNTRRAYVDICEFINRISSKPWATLPTTGQTLKIM